jgi:hypothetical protein
MQVGFANETCTDIRIGLIGHGWVVVVVCLIWILVHLRTPVGRKGNRLNSVRANLESLNSKSSQQSLTRIAKTRLAVSLRWSILPHRKINRRGQIGSPQNYIQRNVNP